YAGKLGALQETDQQQDITFLANKSGWDARAVALAALADQFGQITVPAATPPSAVVARPPIVAPRGPAIPPAAGGPAPPPAPAPVPAPVPAPAAAAAALKPAFYYALFRAGFPANADGLFQASPKAVQSAWELAVKQGVIPQASADELTAAV